MNTPEFYPTTPTQPRTAIYLRVSTEQQSTALQRAEIERICASRQLTITHVFEEQASAVKHRPEFERMMAAARTKSFSHLVIWALDRFGRSLAGNVNDMLALDRLGVTVISAREPWMDTAGPVRDLLVSIFSWVAQQERARLIERTKAGIAARRALKPDWGRRSQAHYAHPDRLQDAIALAQQWAQEGRKGGLRGLGTLLGGCSPTTASRIAAKAGLEPGPDAIARNQTS